jgi:hypothetical protein
MTREDALKLVAEREVFPQTYIGVPYGEVLARIDVSAPEFSSICHKFTNYEIFDIKHSAWDDPVRIDQCLQVA